MQRLINVGLSSRLRLPMGDLQFEADLAAFGKAKHALGCANGTDALALPLMAWGIGRGDAVFVPSFTFAATAEVVPWFDAEPVFVDHTVYSAITAFAELARSVLVRTAVAHRDQQLDDQAFKERGRLLQNPRKQVCPQGV